MLNFHQLQSYFPHALADHKIGLLQLMLNSLSGTPETLAEWGASIVWSEDKEEWQQQEAPLWHLKMRDHSVRIKPQLINRKGILIAGEKTDWAEVSLLFVSEDIQSDSLSGFNPRILPLLEQIAVAMYKVLRPEEIFLSRVTSIGCPWLALRTESEEQIWNFDLAIFNAESSLHRLSAPPDYERRGLNGNIQVIRSKWVSFDMKKGATKRS